MSQFQHHDLRLLNPRFDSPLLDVLTDLEYLRRLEIRGSTPAPVFMQLKQVFHLLESLASARIEWFGQLEGCFGGVSFGASSGSTSCGTFTHWYYSIRLHWRSGS